MLSIGANEDWFRVFTPTEKALTVQIGSGPEMRSHTADHMHESACRILNTFKTTQPV